MSCELTQSVLHGYVDGELDAAIRVSTKCAARIDQKLGKLGRLSATFLRSPAFFSGIFWSALAEKMKVFGGSKMCGPGGRHPPCVGTGGPPRLPLARLPHSQMEAPRVLRLLPSPKLLAVAAALVLGVSAATPQDDAKKSEKLPIPRVVGGSPKTATDDAQPKPKAKKPRKAA